MDIAPATRITAALIAALSLTPVSRADFIPWTYSWSNSPNAILADNPATGGQITLTNEGNRAVVGDSDIVATNIRTVSTAAPSAPDTFTAKAYTLTLTLTDTASGQSGTAAFTGVFNGSMTATSSDITNTFTSPTTKVLFLGNNEYTINLDAYTPPGPTGSINAGGIGAHATVTVESVGVASSSPEPDSLVLAALGLPLAYFGFRRKLSARTSATR